MTHHISFYCWKQCSTCRDAKRMLDSLDIQVQERDFFENRLSRDELSNLLELIGLDDLFSWRSPSAKPFRSRRGEISNDEAIEIMLDEPRLIRRPILVVDDAKAIVGFDKDGYQSI